MELTNLTIMNALCDYRRICAKASMLTLLMQENTEYACFERDALEKEYFSYRRSAQKGENSGRQISVIGLLDEALF